MTHDILNALDRMSKVHLEVQLKNFIRVNTEKCGKVKLLLMEGRFYVESVDSVCFYNLDFLSINQFFFEKK